MQDIAPSPQALDVLEARVAAVEMRVFGPRGPAAAAALAGAPAPEAAAAAPAGGDAPPAAAPPPPAQASAAEALASAHALLQAATSGREKAAAVLHRRLLELDGYLSLATAGAADGAQAAGTAAAAAARWPLVQREEPALREAAEQLRRLAALRPVLDPRPLTAATALRPTLAAAAARANADREAALRLALEVAELREQQKEALEHVTQGLALLEAQVSRLEIASKPRQPVD